MHLVHYLAFWLVLGPFSALRGMYFRWGVGESSGAHLKNVFAMGVGSSIGNAFSKMYFRWGEGGGDPMAGAMSGTMFDR